MELQGNHNFLGTQSSSSFQDTGTPFNVTYGTGHVCGTVIKDNVAIAGLALNAHTFGVATTESVDISPDFIPFDGLMGLARSVRASVSNLGRHTDLIICVDPLK